MLASHSSDGQQRDRGTKIQGVAQRPEQLPGRIRTQKQPRSPSALTLLYRRSTGLQKDTWHSPPSSRLPGPPQNVAGWGSPDGRSWAQSRPTSASPALGSNSLYRESRFLHQLPGLTTDPLCDLGLVPFDPKQKVEPCGL